MPTLCALYTSERPRSDAPSAQVTSRTELDTSQVTPRLIMRGDVWGFVLASDQMRANTRAAGFLRGQDCTESCMKVSNLSRVRVNSERSFKAWV